MRLLDGEVMEFPAKGQACSNYRARMNEVIGLGFGNWLKIGLN